MRSRVNPFEFNLRESIESFLRQDIDSPICSVEQCLNFFEVFCRYGVIGTESSCSMSDGTGSVHHHSNYFRFATQTLQLLQFLPGNNGDHRLILFKLGKLVRNIRKNLRLEFISYYSGFYLRSLVTLTDKRMNFEFSMTSLFSSLHLAPKLFHFLS